jgi:hypothetical protein
LIVFMVVVLPDPEPPTTAMKLSAWIRSDTSRSAKLRPPSKVLLTCSNSMRAAGAMLSPFSAGRMR